MSKTMTLGQRIRELREEHDFSLRELAKKIGVTPPFLSDVELGKRYPSEKNLIKISKELNVSKEELSSYDNRPPVDDLRRLTNLDPEYGIAFRKVINKAIEKKISSKDLIDFIDKKTKRKK